MATKLTLQEEQFFNLKKKIFVFVFALKTKTGKISQGICFKHPGSVAGERLSFTSGLLSWEKESKDASMG